MIVGVFAVSLAIAAILAWWGVVADRDGILVAALVWIIFAFGAVVGSVLG